MEETIETINVQVDFVNGKVGTYECYQRPFFYKNNTASISLVDGATLVISMAQVIMITY